MLQEGENRAVDQPNTVLRSRSEVGGTAALFLALVALAFALVAAPGGLVWLRVFNPGLGLPNEGLLSLLANVVTIPMAVMSWLVALSSNVLAIVMLIRRHGGRRAVVALCLGGPGAILGTVLVVVVTAQFATATGLVPGPDDAKRQADARAVASHLALPTSGPRLIAHCESREGMFAGQRRLVVAEPWSQARVDQIRARLLDYTTSFSSGPTSPSDATKVSFSGTDTRGNSVNIYVSRALAGTQLTTACGPVRLKTDAMRTDILLVEGSQRRN